MFESWKTTEHLGLSKSEIKNQCLSRLCNYCIDMLDNESNIAENNIANKR